jgi:hypothetical protein
VSTPTDSVTSYAGMRTFTLGWTQRPGKPPTGPQAGVDRPGGDLPGSPFTLPSADPNKCWAACNGTTACAAWAYAVPGCDSFAQPTCWLKGADQATTDNKCRVSGAQGSPADNVRVPLLNGAKQFLAGWLDQSYWPDGQYTAPSDAALRFDIQAVRDFGMNFVRMGARGFTIQGVCEVCFTPAWHRSGCTRRLTRSGGTTMQTRRARAPHARVRGACVRQLPCHDSRGFRAQIGVVVWQDMIQKYGGATVCSARQGSMGVCACVHQRVRVRRRPFHFSWPISRRWCLGAAITRASCRRVCACARACVYVRESVCVRASVASLSPKLNVSDPGRRHRVCVRVHAFEST